MSDEMIVLDEWDVMWEVTRRPVCAPAERDEHTALRDAVAAERAAVVEWLRAESRVVLGDAKRLLAWASTQVERGEHRHKEKE
jgi:hypothetical protein